VGAVECQEKKQPPIFVACWEWGSGDVEMWGGAVRVERQICGDRTQENSRRTIVVALLRSGCGDSEALRF